MRLINKTGMALLAAWLLAYADQATDYLIVDAPIGTQSSSKVLWVKWAGISRGPLVPPPDSGTIYFDKAPGGGKLSNYRYKISNFFTDTSINTKDSIRNNIYFPPTLTDRVSRRGSAFRTIDQPNMGFGVFYCVVAQPLSNDTLISNEFQLMVESPSPVDWIGPSGSITSITPTFQWNANSGVPYYHIILSDDVIKIDSSSGTVNLQGLSIIWQAITPATQIVYGDPDPSRTITADPPPLSPGQKYTWVVLNNYGNHPAFSSTKVKLPPGEFSIKGTMLRKPVCVSPVNTSLTSLTDQNVTFKWKNLDKDANTYKLYIYVGSDFEGINAQLVVYQTEVVGSGRDGENEVDSVQINAASVLTSNKYVWRMIAVNDEGAGTVGDTVGFHYEAPIGSIVINTKELIVIGSGSELDTVISPVGLVQLKVEVLDGSLEAPLLFYTDNNGYLKRDRPIGTYRITAVKNEFEELSKTIVVKEGEETSEILYLERPDATVYGKVVDDAGKGINLAHVYGISDRGDTVATKADAQGSFILNCYAADWRIGVDMNGYISAIAQKITVTSAENYDFGTVKLDKNPFTLSGIVKNTSGSALLGARVRIYKEGTLISEVPSTPQSGTFSFTIPAGSYVLTSDKTGFTSYSKTVDVMSSKSITVSMEPGAALLTGYVYGRTWVGEREVIAPITGARIYFVKDSTNDTVSVLSDPTYGDYKASLSGEKKYYMTSLADGYVSTRGPVAFVTVPKTTVTMHDTLQGLGMLSGSVVMSAGGIAVSGVGVNLLGATDNQIIATGKSTVNGTFELRKIPDGTYLVSSAREGLVVDSISGNDTIRFSKGKASVISCKIYLKPGDKTIKWNITTNYPDLAVVKIQTPLVKTLKITDSIVKAGPGTYIMNVDAPSDSVIDLSYHQFTVPDTVSVFTDTISLHVLHRAVDTLTPDKGMVTLMVQSAIKPDSVILYVKDAVATTFKTISADVPDTLTTMTFTPPRDGSTMLYFFKVYCGKDVYGYDKEQFKCYVNPDRSMLTRFEITPSTDGTFSFPAGYDAEFSVKGYVSSSFYPAPALPGDGLSWRLSNAQGAVLKNSKGATTILTTGRDRTTEAIALYVTIDTSKILLAPGLSPDVKISIDVTGGAIKTIIVKRTDAANPNPISTSSTDKAEFRAFGIDENNKSIDLFPGWAISPKEAGTISSDGTFRPTRNIAGMVRVFATVGKIYGEYKVDENTAPGLNVRFMMVNKSTHDTVKTGTGCNVIFPPEIVGAGDIGLLQIGTTVLKNQFKRGSGRLRIIDTVAFELDQLENISLDLGEDSIRLQLEIPKTMQKDAKKGLSKLSIAQWLDDSLMWKKVDGSEVDDDGTTVSAKLGHFSRYSIVYEPTDNIKLDIAPNPFSPYITPKYNPFNKADAVIQKPGTCIRIHADVTEFKTAMKLDIYTMNSDRVWSMDMQNADNIPYFIWWDGTTSSRQLQPAGTEHVISIPGDRMCRNGRYFAVLTAKVNGKDKRVMKQIILMK